MHKYIQPFQLRGEKKKREQTVLSETEVESEDLKCKCVIYISTVIQLQNTSVSTFETLVSLRK